MTRYRHIETVTWEDDNPNVEGLRDLLLQIVQGRTACAKAKVIGTWERIDEPTVSSVAAMPIGPLSGGGGPRAMAWAGARECSVAAPLKLRVEVNVE